MHLNIFICVHSNQISEMKSKIMDLMNLSIFCCFLLAWLLMSKLNHILTCRSKNEILLQSACKWTCVTAVHRAQLLWTPYLVFCIWEHLHRTLHVCTSSKPHWCQPNQHIINVESGNMRRKPVLDQSVEICMRMHAHTHAYMSRWRLTGHVSSPSSWS